MLLAGRSVLPALASVWEHRQVWPVWPRCSQGQMLGTQWPLLQGHQALVLGSPMESSGLRGTGQGHLPLPDPSGQLLSLGPWPGHSVSCSCSQGGLACCRPGVLCGVEPRTLPMAMHSSCPPGQMDSVPQSWVPGLAVGISTVAGEGRDGKVGSEMAENLVRSIPVLNVLREGRQGCRSG